MKCPKCGKSEGRETINKRAKQRVWHCAACGKLVNLGKAESNIDNKDERGSEAATQTGSPARKKQTRKPGRNKASASSHRDARAGSTGKQRPVRAGIDLRKPDRRIHTAVGYVLDFFDL